MKNYPLLKKYQSLYFMNLGIRKTIINIQVNQECLDLIINDMKTLFWIKDEMILHLDLGGFTEGHFTSSLFGSPAGYIGYEDGGILTEHVLKFPISIVVIKNYTIANVVIIKQIESILREGKITDSKGRSISFKNTIFIFLEAEKTHALGFVGAKQTNKKINEYIDELIFSGGENEYYHNKLNELLVKLRRFHYEIIINIKNIDFNIYNKLIKEIINFEKIHPYQKYVFKINKNKEIVKTLKRS